MGQYIYMCMYLCAHPESGRVIAELDGQSHSPGFSQLVGGGGDGVASDCLHPWNVEVYPIQPQTTRGEVEAGVWNASHKLKLPLSWLERKACVVYFQYKALDSGRQLDYFSDLCLGDDLHRNEHGRPRHARSSSNNKLHMLSRSRSVDRIAS